MEESENTDVDFKSESTERIREKAAAREREIVIIDEKLKWNAKSKIGSLDNTTHKPGGGGRGSIVNEKLSWQGKILTFVMNSKVEYSRALNNVQTVV